MRGSDNLECDDRRQWELENLIRGVRGMVTQRLSRAKRLMGLVVCSCGGAIVIFCPLIRK
jgi:hypothetical protein